MISDSIRRQSVQISENIKLLFDSLDEEDMKNTIGVFPVWKQIYHLLHSLDKNFIDPNSFREPEIHQKNLDIIYINSEAALSKSKLFEYYLEVIKKVNDYLSVLDEKELENEISFKDLTLTKVELILAQFRHIFYHIGYLHCCIKQIKGETPEYVGIYKAEPEK